ncbi:uncharacterized protein T551_03658 [Pneumocystis jirovecii RU7]|uniref:N-alpha-acetyltransferase 40 n=1 Tax=Pneumocystis jirovecii (strain RU7) TaxID=1408657 RepID=A0A0W4ZBY5_PNEJ7|nr:uncharacterized protein T551_03658 [Pneumocystis jirovecii RU7]KTW25822.1 hypothetical protein T551_03658 [Pneumocystis jirovecii RU7]
MKEINLVKSKNNNKEKQVQKNNIVEIANNVCLNTLRNLIPYNKIYNFKNNDVYDIQLFDIKNIKKDDIYTCFRLVKNNLEEMYKKSSMGWSSRRKIKEMREEYIKYIIVRKDGQHDIVGFLSYQIVIEGDECVIYCYEVQVMQKYHRSGIGYHLMNIMESLGLKLGLQKAMLTVFNSNERALFNISLDTLKMKFHHL